MRPSRERKIPSRYRDESEEEKETTQPPSKRSKKALSQIVVGIPNVTAGSGTTQQVRQERVRSQQQQSQTVSTAQQQQTPTFVVTSQHSDIDNENSDDEIPDLDTSDDNIEIADENKIKIVQNTSSPRFPSGPPTKDWSLTNLKDFLKHHKKKSSGMNKSPLLNLALVTWSNYSKSEFSAEDIQKFRAVELDLIEKRRTFDSDLTWEDIFEFGKEIIPQKFNSEIINSFLRSNFVSIQEKIVYSEIDKPAVKGQEMYYSDMIQRCQTACNEDLVMFRAEIGASMRDVIR